MKNIALALFAIATLTWSCQKEVNGDPAGNEPADGQKYLSKYTYSEPGISSVDSFLYDQQNRCIRINSTYIDSNAIAPTIDFYRFYYNGNDKYPYKMTDSSDGRDMNGYFFYDNQNRLIKDSVVFLRSGGGWIVRYDYKGNNVVATTTFAVGPGIPAVEVDSLESDGTNWTRYSYTGSSFHYEFRATYDNHPGAFSGVNVASVLLYGVTYRDGNFTQRSKNNPLSITVTSGLFLSYVYSYDASGYPVSAIVNDPTTPGNVSIKFQYK